jgi:hypothetical protein
VTGPDRELLHGALGCEALSCAPVDAGGYTKSRAWRIETRDGPAFVKEAEDEGSLAMLRREAVVYGGVAGPFLPGFVGFADAGERAVLAIELLEDAYWPPPYPADVAPLFDALELVRATEPPVELPAQGPWRSRWAQVAADPGPLLGLGLCSAAWLERSLEALLAAEADAVFEGDSLVHNDVYSANVAFADRGAVLVDWGAAVRGSPWIDVGLAALNVRVESGSAPRVEIPDPAPLVSAFAGHFAVEAPAPLPDWADPESTLRADMAGDLAHALRWAAELLELPPVS